MGSPSPSPRSPTGGVWCGCIHDASPHGGVSPQPERSSGNFAMAGWCGVCVAHSVFCSSHFIPGRLDRLSIRQCVSAADGRGASVGSGAPRNQDRDRAQHGSGSGMKTAEGERILGWFFDLGCVRWGIPAFLCNIQRSVSTTSPGH